MLEVLKGGNSTLLQLRALPLGTGPSYFHTRSDGSPISHFDVLTSNRETAGTVTGSLRAYATRGARSTDKGQASNALVFFISFFFYFKGSQADLRFDRVDKSCVMNTGSRNEAANQLLPFLDPS